MTTEPTPTPDLAEALRGVTDPGERLHVRVMLVLHPITVAEARGDWLANSADYRQRWRALAAALRAEALAEAIAVVAPFTQPGIEADDATEILARLRALAAQSTPAGQVTAQEED